MSEDSKNALALKKAELAAKAAAIQQELADLAELERLAAKLGVAFTAMADLEVGKISPAEADKTFTSFKEPAAEEPLPALTESAITLDGTVAGLVHAYWKHPGSPYHNLRAKVKVNYDGILKRLMADIGASRIADFDRDKIQKLYEGWAASGKIALAYALIGRLRIVLSFGMNVLDDFASTRLYSIMHTMTFPLPKKRVQRLTRNHVAAIREAAHQIGWHSIALAQVLQYELGLKQLEVIGEWVPLSSSEESDVVIGDQKWVRGLRWEQISSDGILQGTTTSLASPTKEFAIDLKEYPNIMEELEWVGRLPKNGPVIVAEFKGMSTNNPYSESEYRRKWRIVADKAGLPKGIRNADSFKGEEPPKLDAAPAMERVH